MDGYPSQENETNRALTPKANPKSDPKFAQSVNFTNFDDNIGVLKALRLHPLKEKFRDAIIRVRSLCATPTGMVFMSNRHGQILAQARIDLGLKADDESKDDDEEMLAARMRFWDAWTRKHDAMGEEATFATWVQASRETTLIIEMSHLAWNAGVPGGAMVDGACNILNSMLSSAYGAFEVLASALWIEMVNADDEVGANWGEKNKGKKLTFGELAGLRFSLSGKLGSTLVQTRKVSFQSLSDIKKAYSAAFKGAADVCFDPPDGIAVVEKVRHLLSHRSGIVDAKFLQEIAGHPVYAKLSLGETIPLDGVNVRDHVSACVASAIALLQFSDGWLTKKGLN